jgi:chromosome segregation ATPase
LTRQLEERDSWIRDLEARAAGAEARVDDLEAEQERLEGALADSQKAAPTGELQTLQEELDSVRRSAARSQKETRWAEERVRKLERELEAALSEIEEAEETNLSLELSERVSELEAENRALSAKLKRAVQAAEPYERELSETEQELEETHESLLAVTEELARAKKELGRSRKELEEKNAQPSQGPHKARDGAPRDGAREKLSSPELDADLQRLEEQLIERAAKIQELEEQLRKLEIFSKTLTVELSQSHGKGQVEQLEGELDRISQSLAEREADLVAAEWTIGELKQRLSARTG